MAETTPQGSIISVRSNSMPRSGSASDLRRYQLIEVAASLIVRDGVEALKHASIAEHAGCTRPLVYRYFPKKHDIYIAISEDFYEALNDRIAIGDQIKTVPGATTGDLEEVKGFITTIWDLIEQKSLAAIALRCAPSINQAFTAYTKEVREKHDSRWVTAYMSQGVSQAAAELLNDNIIACLNNTMRSYIDGQFDRETALKKVSLTSIYLLKAELDQLQ